MTERRQQHRDRTLLGGKIVFNDRRSVIDCVVRNLSDGGACLQVNNTTGLPIAFDLRMDGDSETRACRVVWMSETRAGVEFVGHRLRDGAVDASALDTAPAMLHPQAERRSGPDLVRGELLTLRAALDEVPVGIVLLDSDTRAQFINRAFRKMWRLPDAIADGKPPFVALMYHGRDTNAYAVPAESVDDYVAERVAHIKGGNPRPLTLRLTSGEVIRLQCSVLPSGGRMLCYTYVTDIVQRSDELEMFRRALDQMPQGIVLLDEHLNAQFMNRAVRDLWGVSDEQAERKPSYVELVTDSRKTGAYRVPAGDLAKFIASRVTIVRDGDSTPIDIPHSDGRMIRAQCAVLPNAGRMLTYTDVTDLVRRAAQFEELATRDSLTGLCNRRQFDALADVEWARFQRYQRPLTLMLLDIDHFKQINDRLGHEHGDRAIKQVAAMCAEGTRATDVVARIGGDEFAILLPETELEQARIVAERLRQTIRRAASHNGDDMPVSVSIGIAEASLSMAGMAALAASADRALYAAKAAGRDCVRLAAKSGPSGHQAAAE